MRVISGSLKGRVIKGYDIEGTRPTMDRVKESVMASIQDYLENSIVLDLFAGSGNLGIEAISNGARKCYFVDHNKECIRVIQGNLREFGIEEQSVVIGRDYRATLEKFREEGLVFDVIFIDPPYRYKMMEEILKLILKYGIVQIDSVVVLEYSDEKLENVHERYQIMKYKKFGDKCVSIYRVI